MELTTAPSRPISYAAPTSQKERVVILDSLRGFAILGILLMNIHSFGLPGDPSFNRAGKYKTLFVHVCYWPWGRNFSFLCSFTTIHTLQLQLL